MPKTKTFLKQKMKPLRLAYYEKATQIKVGSQYIVKMNKKDIAVHQLIN